MSYSAILDGAEVAVAVLDEHVSAGSLEFPYVDMDEVHVDGWDVTLSGPGRTLTLGQLGTGRDAFLRDLRRARLPVRRAAMLQSGAAAPIDAYEGRSGEQQVLIGLHGDGITVEADTGAPRYLPLSCITEVERDGYTITLHARGLEPVVVSRLGPRTDEFLADLERARRDLAAATRAAYAGLDPALATLTAADGWAVTRAMAGSAWEALRAAAGRTERAQEIALLDGLAGDALRLGVKSAFAGSAMLFALAPCNGKVAVEAADAEGRATFVFACDDVERLNAVLLLTSFRREALFAEDDALGRWAVAVRMLEAVRWAREALVARVVHDGRWAQRVSEVLG